MEISIKGTPEETAALVVKIQERQMGNEYSGLSKAEVAERLYEHLRPVLLSALQEEIDDNS